MKLTVGEHTRTPAGRKQLLFLTLSIISPVKSVELPAAYLLTVNEQNVLDLLRIHGIRLEKLTSDTEIRAERFEIAELKGSQRLSQGHYINSVKGTFRNETQNFPAGTVVVRMDQPLASVCAYLLEPQSGEGLLAWNFLDRYLVPQWGMGYLSYPVCKVMGKADFRTIPFN
ncbi:peptidase M14 carboxypeptidase A [sediment metagenome]|uniref:Peptidase M14 carboxypeptidase A n=1 Tax=sediment metagenome TaxID=749907 RepID=D9PI21_9ZZZZ